VQQVKLYMKHVATRRIQTVAGTIGMVHGSTISSTQTGGTSCETLIHLSYQSMDEATSCQKHLKQQL
jgi:hypothetical protein